MSVTKILFPIAEYHQFTEVDLSDGDILDVCGSLGGRSARTVTIEALAGDTILRFNVTTKIYKDFGPNFNSWVGLGQGNAHRSPVLVDEIIEPKDNVTIAAGSTATWLSTELDVKDIQCVSLGAAFRITLT